MRSMGLLQTLALSLLLVSAVLPDAAADVKSQLRSLKQFGAQRLHPDHIMFMHCSDASSD